MLLHSPQRGSIRTGWFWNALLCQIIVFNLSWKAKKGIHSAWSAFCEVWEINVTFVHYHHLCIQRSSPGNNFLITKQLPNRVCHPITWTPVTWYVIWLENLIWFAHKLTIFVRYGFMRWAQRDHWIAQG